MMRPGDVLYGQIWILPEVATLGRLAPHPIPPDRKVEIIKLCMQLQRKIKRRNRELAAIDLTRYADEIRTAYLGLRDALNTPPKLANTDGDPFLSLKRISTPSQRKQPRRRAREVLRAAQCAFRSDTDQVARDTHLRHCWRWPRPRPCAPAACHRRYRFRASSCRQWPQPRLGSTRRSRAHDPESDFPTRLGPTPENAVESVVRENSVRQRQEALQPLLLGLAVAFDVVPTFGPTQNRCNRDQHDVLQEMTPCARQAKILQLRNLL